MKGSMQAGEDDVSDVNSEDSLFNSERDDSDPVLEEGVYLVERILAQKDTKDGVRYLVEWKGYPLEDCTWEPESSFEDKSILKAWERERANTHPDDLFDWEAWDEERALEEYQRELEEKRKMEEEEAMPKSAKDFINPTQRRGRRKSTQVTTFKDTQTQSSKAKKKKTSSMSFSKFIVPDDEVSDMEDDYHSEDEDEDEDLSMSEEVRVSRGDPATLFDSDEKEDDDDDDLPIVRKKRANDNKATSGGEEDKKTASEKKAKKTSGNASSTVAMKRAGGDPTKAKGKAKDHPEAIDNAVPKALPPAIQFSDAPKTRRRSMKTGSGDALAAQKNAVVRAGPGETPAMRMPKSYKNAHIMHIANMHGRREPPPNLNDLQLFRPGEKPANSLKSLKTTPTEAKDPGKVLIQETNDPPVPPMAPPAPIGVRPTAPAAPARKMSFQEYTKKKHSLEKPLQSDAKLRNQPVKVTPLNLSNLPSIPKTTTGARRGSAISAGSTGESVDMDTPMTDSPVEEVSFHNPHPFELHSVSGTPAPSFPSDITGMQSLKMNNREFDQPRGISIDSIQVTKKQALERGPIDTQLMVGKTGTYVGRLQFLDPSPEFRRFWSKCGEEQLVAQHSLSVYDLDGFVTDFGGPEELLNMQLKAIPDKITSIKNMLEALDCLWIRAPYWQMLIFDAKKKEFIQFFGLPAEVPSNSQLRALFFYMGYVPSPITSRDCWTNEENEVLTKFEHDQTFALKQFAGVDVSKLINGLDDPLRQCAVIFIHPGREICGAALEEMKNAFECYDCIQMTLEEFEDFRTEKNNFHTSYTVMVHWTLVTEIFKIPLLQTLRMSHDARFYFWGARPKRISDFDKTGYRLYTETPLEFWREGMVIYVSGKMIRRYPEIIKMVQDFLDENPKTSKMMVASNFDILQLNEINRRHRKMKPNDEYYVTSVLIGYLDAPWANGEGRTPHHDERYEMIQDLEIDEKMSDEALDLNHQARAFARRVMSKDIYPNFRRYLFLNSDFPKAEIRERYPHIEFNTPETLSSFTKIKIMDKHSMLKRIEKEHEEYRQDEAFRKERLSRGQNLLTDKEIQEAKEEAVGIVTKLLQDTFAPDEDEYYLSAS